MRNEERLERGDHDCVFLFSHIKKYREATTVTWHSESEKILCFNDKLSMTNLSGRLESFLLIPKQPLIRRFPLSSISRARHSRTDSIPQRLTYRAISSIRRPMKELWQEVHKLVNCNHWVPLCYSNFAEGNHRRTRIWDEIIFNVND